MDNSKYYDKSFYNIQSSGSYRAAKEVLNVVFELVSPKSIVDVGCGIGTWLEAIKELKPDTEILGIDGDYVDVNMLRIPKQSFQSADITKSVQLNKKWDMAISLEVGEHLPTETSEIFVSSLTAASDLVLFSAAIPQQGGTNHINEQFPEFWAAIFEKYGFICVDAVRKRIWNNNEINFPYRQNVLFFVKETALNNYPALQPDAIKTDAKFLTRIHPYPYLERSIQMKHLSSVSSVTKYLGYIIKKNMLKGFGKSNTK